MNKTTLSDEIAELYELYLYMKNDGFNDNRFLETAEHLVVSGHYSPKSLVMMKSIYNIEEVISKPKIKFETSPNVKTNIVDTTDPCSRSHTSVSPHC